VKRPGRPKSSSELKRNLVKVGFTELEKTQIRQAQYIVNVTAFSEFVRQGALEKARKINKKEKV
jgi:hypothetical protein